VSQLPPEPTPFIGRVRDVARIAAALADARLVTVSGPPGIGKTRTAVHAARASSRRAFFCDLTQASDATALASEVARCLALTLRDDPIEAIGQRLARHGAPLLVLDNFEQLAELAAATVGRWLELAPEAQLLVTSRERLRLREERVIELMPLDVPEAGGDIYLSDAVTLFIDRARAHRPDYAPAAADHPKIAEVVRALEGIPLAIELAAARLDALGLDGLHARLSRRLELLSRGARGSDRQATLRSAIDGSWQLLDERQRRALARCSVFRGGFTVATAEPVLGPDALDVIQDLRDRSLVWSPESGRFALYESIRAFAAAELEASGDREAAEAAHRAAILDLACKHAELFHREGRRIDVLVRERDNLLAAYERALAAGLHAEAARAVLTLGPVLATRGPARFHLELLDRIRETVEDDPLLLRERAFAKRLVGDVAGAEADLLAGLELTPAPSRRGSPETPALVGPLYVMMRKDLGLIYHQRRAIDQARACYESALMAAQGLGDRRLEAIVTGNLGALDHDIGHFEEAHERYTTALDMLRQVNDARLEANFWTNLGVLEQEEGNAKVARKHYQRALALLDDVSDHLFEAIALGNLGLLEHEAGALDAARARHEQALALLSEFGEVHSEALCRARLGAVLAAQGELDAAERQLDAAERLVAGRDRLELELMSLHRCFLDLASGDHDAAFARVEAAQASRDGRPALAEVHDDARLLLRMLARSLEKGPGPRLEVGPGAVWFRCPGGPRESLEKYAAARNILDCLARERLAHPGRALSADDLFTAGWPGVKIASQSANNRLYVALAKLRKAGLKLLLMRSGEGYLLDPNTPVLRVDTA
jgi:predicted ATPase/predicted negative regulator of RcsB-dependent stress response